jgi:O-antigen/teichoic acid export membrane protein
LLLLALFGFLSVWVVIDPLLSFVPAYQSGKWVFFILMMGRIIDMYFGLNGVIFSTSKKYKIDLIFTLFLIGSVYFVNLWLIPDYGIVGAAISTSLAYLFYNLLRGFYIQHHYNLYPFQWVQLKLLFLGTCVYFIFWFLGQVASSFLSMQPFVQIVVNELLLLLVFVLPIFIWNLEPETVGYIQRTWKKWRGIQL